jgi:predicted PurR-regulated permease PerM
MLADALPKQKEMPDDSPREPDHELEDRLARRLLDVFIRAGLVLALVLLCYHIFSPFLTMMLWALILAITLYPLHQMLAGRIGGKQGLASTLIVLLAVAVIVTPTVMLGSQFGDSVHELVNGCARQHAQVPAPSDKVAAWPVVGKKVHALWSQAHDDLPALVKSMQPKIGELATKALGIVAGLGGGLLMFVFSFIVAGIMMAFGESGARPCRRSSSASPGWPAARSSPSCRPRRCAPSPRGSSASPASRRCSSASR